MELAVEFSKEGIYMRDNLWMVGLTAGADKSIQMALTMRVNGRTPSGMVRASTLDQMVLFRRANSLKAGSSDDSKI